MDLKELTEKQNFTFKKSLGQNFISDSNLLSAIVKDAQIEKTDAVVEIGAGAGTLTKTISQNAKKVFAFEIDSSLKGVLQENLKDCPNVTLYFCDFLKADITALEKEIGGPYKVVANIPYNISTPLITRLMEKTQNCLSLTVTMQREVAERIISQGGKEYGALSVCVQSRADAVIKRKIVKECFYPQPTIDSALIHIVFKGNKLADGEFFRSLVKAAFGSRRKTLQNNITANFNISRQKLGEIYSQLGVDANCRAEELSPKQFIMLAEKLKSYI